MQQWEKHKKKWDNENKIVYLDYDNNFETNEKIYNSSSIILHELGVRSIWDIFEVVLINIE